VVKEFDEQALTECDGSQDGVPTYIAHDGKIYDVSASKIWKGGMHMKRHQAGRDLTAELPAAPHGEEVFERYPQIGVLLNKNDVADQHLPPWLARLLERYPLIRKHPHPMLVHYPIVFMFATAGFIVLALITGIRSFETTAFHCLGGGLIFTPLAMASGFLTWWINYQAKTMRQVRIKIVTSFFLLLDAIIIFSWRMLVPDIFFNRGADGFLYIFLICALVPMVSIIGWFGAELTFPLAKKEK
jgi:predicted heme/steroid binding protein/uncharacterized membrane protein